MSYFIYLHTVNNGKNFLRYGNFSIITLEIPKKIEYNMVYNTFKEIYLHDEKNFT